MELDQQNHIIYYSLFVSKGKNRNMLVNTRKKGITIIKIPISKHTINSYSITILTKKKKKERKKVRTLFFINIEINIIQWKGSRYLKEVLYLEKGLVNC